MRSRHPPLAHQVQGTETLVKWDSPETGRVFGGCFFLADEPGVGKTKQVIDAAQVLYERGEIDQVVVVCPKSVRDVWYDEEIGELNKHLWTDLMSKIFLIKRGKTRYWIHGPKTERWLTWQITNYEFMRDPGRAFEHLEPDGRTWLVLDESSAIKGWKSQQTRGTLEVRRACGRVTLLNGTPQSHSPADLYSQSEMMHPGILACKNFFAFRGRYAVMGGYLGKQIVAWRNIEDLQRRLAPYVLRRLKRDCHDLPPRLDPVTHSVALDKESWRLYVEMRDELLTWLSENTHASASHAGAKVIRLAQICAGFLRGVIDEKECENCDGESGHVCEKCGGTGLIATDVSPRVIGSEKLDWTLDFIGERLEEEPDLKLIIWCRFRAELHRLQEEIGKRFDLLIGGVHGGQKGEDRSRSIRLLHPDSAPKGPAVVLGTPTSGAKGLNFSASHTVLWESYGTSLEAKIQADDRVDRPGQKSPISYFNICATGPDGQRTVDHTLIKKMIKKEDLATWTTSAWVTALRSEME